MHGKPPADKSKSNSKSRSKSPAQEEDKEHDVAQDLEQDQVEVEVEDRGMTIASFIDASSGNPYDMSMELGTATVRSFDKTAHGIMLSNIAITKLAGILAGQKPDALTTSGDSGGALLNENGEVIGVLSSGLSAGEGLPLDARFVNIQDPGPGGWLSKLVGSDRLSVLGYVKGWLWDTPVQATRNAAGAADAPDDAASAQADDSDARAKAAAAAQARADAAASAR